MTTDDVSQNWLTVAAREIELGVRLGRRELRYGVRGFGVFFVCLAVGVAAVVAVAALAACVDASLKADAKKLLGGDLEFRRSHLPLSNEAQAYLRSAGALSAGVRMRSMARTENAPPTLVELKTVDAAYPLFGQVALDPDIPLDQALAQVHGYYGAVVAPLLLERLGLAIGDHVSVGQATYRVAATIVREPDRAASLLSLGPRFMVTDASFASTGLDAPGSLVFHVYGFRLARPVADLAALEAFKDEFRQRYPENGVQIRDYTTASTGLKRFMDNLSRYLTLVGLLALLVGGVGVANGVHGYLETKIEVVATMKCLGARRRQVVMVYLVQTLVLAAFGSLLGVAVGLAAAWVVSGPVLAQLGLARPAGLAIPLGPAWLGLADGMLISLIFALWPLSAAGSVPAAQLFRGYADLTARRPSRRARVAVAVLVLALVGITLVAVGKPAVVLGFAGFVAASIGLFRVAAWGLARVAAGLPRAPDLRLRLALANIHRPGNLTADVVFSLGLGLAALAAVTLVDANMQQLIRTQVAEAAPAYFFLDIPADRVEEFRASLPPEAGVSKIDAEPSLRGRIVKINATPAEKAKVDPAADWAIRGDRSLSYARTPPPNASITAGAWWPADYAGPPLICLSADLGRGFGVGVGDSLTINVLGRDIEARIACLREIEWLTFALNHAIVFAPGALDKAPHSFLATAYFDKATGPQAERAALQRFQALFPDVAVVYVKDVLVEVTHIMENIALAVRATAAVTLVVGFLVLAESMRAALRRRYREAVIFKVLGARRRDIMAVLSLETLLLGAATACLAAALGAAASYVFVAKVLERAWSLHALPLFLVCAAGATAPVALGLAGVSVMLRKKAWPVLRNE